jgi:hypothetical protein
VKLIALSTHHVLLFSLFPLNGTAEERTITISEVQSRQYRCLLIARSKIVIKEREKRKFRVITSRSLSTYRDAKPATEYITDCPLVSRTVNSANIVCRFNKLPFFHTEKAAAHLANELNCDDSLFGSRKWGINQQPFSRFCCTSHRVEIM